MTTDYNSIIYYFLLFNVCVFIFFFIYFFIYYLIRFFVCLFTYLPTCLLTCLLTYLLTITAARSNLDFKRNKQKMLKGAMLWMLY